MSTITTHIADKIRTTLHSFRLILDGRALNDEVVEALVRGGCADGFFGVERGVQTVDFDREAATFEEAVLSAIRDVEESVDGLYVVRVEPDDLVTASAIAERTGRTRQNIAQLIAGQRGPGGFPAPLSDEYVRVWRWSDVSHWLAELTPGGEQLFDHRQNHYIAALNGALQARQHLRAYSLHGGSPECAGVVENLVDEKSGMRTGCSHDGHSPIRNERQSSHAAGSGGPVVSVVIIVDVSSSMTSVIGNVNDALVQMQRVVVEDEYAGRRVDFMLIEAGSEARLVTGPVLARDLRVPRLEPSGSTALGAGIELALDLLGERNRLHKNRGVSAAAPLVIVLTDGEPTDAWEPAAHRVRHLASAGRLRFIAIGTPTANHETLRAICPQDMPPRTMRDGAIANVFSWISTTVSHAARSGAAAAQRLPATTTWEEPCRRH